MPTATATAQAQDPTPGRAGSRLDTARTAPPSARAPAAPGSDPSAPGNVPRTGPGRGPARGRPARKDRQARGAGPGPGPGPGTGTGQPWNGREKAGGDKTRLKAVNRPAVKRLLVYVLDVPATLSQNQIVIDLARRQRRPGGDWGPLKPWWHSPGSAQAKYDPEDRELLALLSGGCRPPRRPPRQRPRRPPWRRPRPC